MFLAALSFALLALSSEEGSPSWYEYFNYPGAELWKFFNLFLFLGIGLYLLRRPLRDALRSRREGIKRELERARMERDNALAQLAEVETRLKTLNDEVESIRGKSKAESEAEQDRIKRSTEDEMVKLREQAQREIQSAAKSATHELRQFAAQQSVRLAEDLIRKDIRSEDDERLISINLEELGRARN
jgi:F0F1-type ATP synthase membrane subunit b/b'